MKFWENDPITPATPQGAAGLEMIVGPRPDQPSAQTPDQAALTAQQLEAARLENILRQRELEGLGKDGAPKTEGEAKLREAESKANSFLIRALGANQSYEKQGVGPRSLPDQTMRDTFPNASNYFNSDERQVADTTQDEFIAASLRQDSGAAIPDEELERQRRIYFPMPGDGPAAIEAKRQARLRALEGLLSAGGRAVSEETKTQLMQVLEGAATGSLDTSAPPPNAGGGGNGPLAISETGEMRYQTDEDKQFGSLVQRAFDKGASKAELDQLAVQYGYMPYGADLDEAVRFRDQGGKGARILPPESGYKGPSVLGSMAATPAGSYFAGAANALTGGTLDEIVGATGGDAEQAQAAKEVMRNANPVSSFLGEMTGAGLAMTGVGRVPGLAGRGVAADAAYGAAYGAGESNENRLGGAAVGAGAAAAGTYFGGKLLNKLTGSGSSGDAAQRVAQGKKFKIDIPLGATGRTGAVLEKGLDILPGSAGVMQKGRDVLGSQVEDAVSDVADSFGVPASFSAMGDAAQRGARNWISRFESTSEKAYNAIPISPNAPTDLSNTRGALTALTGRFSSNPKLAQAMQNTRLNAYMDALGDAGEVDAAAFLRASRSDLDRAQTALKAARSGGGNVSKAQARLLSAREALRDAERRVADPGSGKLSWEDLKAFRTRIGEEIGDQRFSDGTLTSELRSLYGALSEDMKASARAQGPQALRAFERANTLYKQGQDRIDGALKSILGDDNKLRPEAAAAKIQQIARSGKSSSDIQKLAEIRKSMPTAEWGEVTNGLIRLMGQPVNSEGRDFSAETFVRTFADMDSAARNLFFGGENKPLRQNLEEFVGVMRNLAENISLRNTSGTAGVANIAALVTLLPTAFVSPPAATALAAQTAGAYYLARRWTNPEFVKFASGYAKMMKRAAATGSPPSASAMAGQRAFLKRVAKRAWRASPILAADLAGVESALFGEEATAVDQ